MSDAYDPRAAELAEALVELDAEIHAAKVTLNESETDRQYEDAISYRVSLLADRQALVEKLEALGLEDPAL